jgi:hypothetical protein
MASVAKEEGPSLTSSPGATRRSGSKGPVFMLFISLWSSYRYVYVPLLWRVTTTLDHSILSFFGLIEGSSSFNNKD